MRIGSFSYTSSHFQFDLNTSSGVVDLTFKLSRRRAIWKKVKYSVGTSLYSYTRISITTAIHETEQESLSWPCSSAVKGENESQHSAEVVQSSKGD